MTLTPQHFEALFARAPGPLVVYDARFTIVAANDAFYRAARVGPEVLGRGVFEVFPENPQDPASRGPASLRASLERVVATGEPDRMPVTRYDIPVPDSGEGGFEERHWSPSSYPVLGDDGLVAFIVHETEDVTELVRLRAREAGIAEALDEAQGVYEAIYDQGPFAGRLGLDGTLIDVNRSALAMCGFAREDVLGKPFWDCGWWSRSPAVRACIRALARRDAGPRDRAGRLGP